MRQLLIVALRGSNATCLEKGFHSLASVWYMQPFDESQLILWLTSVLQPQRGFRVLFDTVLAAQAWVENWLTLNKCAKTHTHSGHIAMRSEPHSFGWSFCYVYPKKRVRFHFCQHWRGTAPVNLTLALKFQNWKDQRFLGEFDPLSVQQRVIPTTLNNWKHSDIPVRP